MTENNCKPCNKNQAIDTEHVNKKELCEATEYVLTFAKGGIDALKTKQMIDDKIYELTNEIITLCQTTQKMLCEAS